MFCIVPAFFLNAQSNTRMEFFPATENYFPSVNVYSTSSGELVQYYIQDGKWIVNSNIGSPEITIKGKDYRLQYLSASDTFNPNLFVYSAQSGEFQFFYLKDSKWVENDLLNDGKVSFKSKDIRMEFSPAAVNKTPYIFAYSVDGKETAVLGISDEKWSKIDYFPSSVK